MLGIFSYSGTAMSRKFGFRAAGWGGGVVVYESFSRRRFDAKTSYWLLSKSSFRIKRFFDLRVWNVYLNTKCIEKKKKMVFK